MTTRMQAIISLLLMAVGAFKTWLHVGTVPILALTTCSGNAVTIELGSQSLLQQIHCWGCYAFTAGFIYALWLTYIHIQKRRSVALRVD